MLDNLLVCVVCVRECLCVKEREVLVLLSVCVCVCVCGNSVW